MTRDEARAHWAASGLTYEAVTNESMVALRNRIHAELRASNLIKGFRANPPQKVKGPTHGAYATLTCAAYYFPRREAVTFNTENSFIGFAGWADDTNVQPILKAFCNWVDDMVRDRPQAVAA